MKAIVNAARILVGALFIFSGLVKAIDPLGLAYKMQEFFEVWARDGYWKSGMDWLYQHALLFSVLMIALEVILGVALLLGRHIKIVSWLLLLLMLFFTFLTSYVLFSGKIRACGCFGDCIPLTPIQTFTKDIILLVLVLVILFGRQHIKPLFSSTVTWALLLLSLLGVSFLQWYVLGHLPVKDCLPYKVGNNIIELRKMPKDAVQDKFDYTFVYEKGGKKQDFKVDAIPDSTWTFVERKEVLVQKGRNNVPLINDFNFKTAEGADTTEAILSQPGNYYLLFLKNPVLGKTDVEEIEHIYQSARTAKIPVYAITSNRTAALDILGNSYKLAEDGFKPAIFTCDMTAIKTAARNDVTLYLMKGPVVQKKWGGKDIATSFK